LRLSANKLPEQENIFAGAIESRTYLGDMSHVRVKLTDGASLLASQGPSEETLPAGAEVFVSFPPEAVVLFDP
jgi:ABC-type Fe3+/spermidine/putrescine transport system ATPase subunit